MADTTDSTDESAVVSAIEFASEAMTLDDVKARVSKRLHGSPSSDALVDAWFGAVGQQAINLALSSSAPPTTLSALRADLLLHICLRMKRLVTLRETEVLLRLSASAARSVHRQMKATYEDQLADYVLAWALEGARTDKGGEYLGVKGSRVIFESKEALDLAKRELEGLGIPVVQKRGENAFPYLLYVGDSAGIKRFNLKAAAPAKKNRGRRGRDASQP